MFRVDQRPFRAAMHALITEADARNLGSFSSDVVALVAEHGLSLTAEDYARQVTLMMYAGNKKRARHLVDCLGDRGWTWTGALLLGALKILAYLWSAGTFIVLVVALYDGCRSGGA